MSNKLFFQLWNPTGMVNQIMSLELAIGLAYETKKDLIIHYSSYSGAPENMSRGIPIFTPSAWYSETRKGLINTNQFPHLLDIIDFDFNLTMIDEQINSFRQEEISIDQLMAFYYYSKEENISEDEILFADGRSRLPVDKNLHLKHTLGWYSRFFYNRSPELDKVLSSIKFKKEYIDLANEISNSLGKFQGMHLRLSDHSKRMFNTTEDMFESWLSKFEENNLPIILSTCEPTNPMVIKNKNRFVLIDDYIIEHFSYKFKSLPFNDEIAFGIICNLVMQNSFNFVGTSGSTFTGYIHRNRHQKGIESWDFFDSPNIQDGLPYSWNNYPLSASEKMWWREWKECKYKFNP